MNLYLRVVCFLCFCASTSGYSQDISKPVYGLARRIVDTLASPAMHGRGYVNDGDKIAANYIKQQFQDFGLKTFKGDNYFQPFSFPVNTFPGKMEFGCIFQNKKNLVVFEGVAGQNFIVSPDAPTLKGMFSSLVFDSSYTTSSSKFEKFRKKIKSANTFVIIDERGVTNKQKLEYFKKVKNGYFEANIIEPVSKLTWSVSREVSKYVKIQVLADSFHFSAKGTVAIDIENKFIESHATQNVIGYIEGSERPDSFIVFSAHYDHLGRMGSSVYFPGANDNASGCAMLLNLVNYYSRPKYKPRYSIVFIAFAGEEAGLLGSKHYTENPLFPMRKIRFLLNTDIMGTGDDGITVVNGSVFKKEFDALVDINKKGDYIKDVKIRGKAANSDHYYFSEKGVNAFFIYTMGGIKAYHDIYDKPQTLPLNEFEDVFYLVLKFIDYLQS